MTTHRLHASEWALWGALFTLPLFASSSLLSQLPGIGSAFFFLRPYHDPKELLVTAIMILLVVRLAWSGPWPGRVTLTGAAVLLILVADIIAISVSEYPREAFYRSLLDVVVILWGYWWWVPSRRRTPSTRIVVAVLELVEVSLDEPGEDASGSARDVPG